MGLRSRRNPGGGGASAATDEPRYRTWGEAYGISARNGAQADFVGDQRQTWGGVAGIGARIAPGVNVGFSVDQSRTTIDVPLACNRRRSISQLGFNASGQGAMDLGYRAGPWIRSQFEPGHRFESPRRLQPRSTGATELSYYWSVDQSRIVPKASLEYTHASTGAFQEIGGLNPEMATGATLERSRILFGAEIGHYWIVDQKILDLSAYGKFVDNVSQNLSSITVSLGPESIAVQGIGESQYGADTGASASLSLSNKARLYINYDGKFRAAMQSHQGTVGVELKW